MNNALDNAIIEPRTFAQPKHQLGRHAKRQRIRKAHLDVSQLVNLPNFGISHVIYVGGYSSYRFAKALNASPAIPPLPIHAPRRIASSALIPSRRAASSNMSNESFGSCIMT